MKIVGKRKWERNELYEEINNYLAQNFLENKFKVTINDTLKSLLPDSEETMTKYQFNKAINREHIFYAGQIDSEGKPLQSVLDKRKTKYEEFSIFF